MEQDHQQLMQDLVAKIAQHLRRELALQGLLPHSADNKRMVTSRILELIDQSGVRLAHRKTAALCLRVGELLVAPLAPPDPAAPDTLTIRGQEEDPSEHDARTRLIQELALKLAGHLRASLDAATLQAYTIESARLLHERFISLCRQSGAELSHNQQSAIYARVLDALFPAGAVEKLLQELAVDFVTELRASSNIARLRRHSPKVKRLVIKRFTPFFRERGVALPPLQTGRLYLLVLQALSKPPSPGDDNPAGAPLKSEI